MRGASCRRSSWTRATGSPSAIRRASARGAIPTSASTKLRKSVDWVHGKLLVKAASSSNHNFDATSLLRNQTGTYTYSSVENFASDALAFCRFWNCRELNPDNQHNCDQTGKVWRDSTGTLRGLGYLPCYSSYSQAMGPTAWQSEHQRLGRICDHAMAAGKSLVLLRRVALGAGAVAAAALPRLQQSGASAY